MLGWDTTLVIDIIMFLPSRLINKTEREDHKQLAVTNSYHRDQDSQVSSEQTFCR